MPDAAAASLSNLFLVFVAIIGVPLAIWRSAVAKQQANASDRQAETAERRLKNELYEKGAEMLGSIVPSVRLGGIYSLKGLTNENPDDYRDQVMELLCAFVRDPPDEKAETPSYRCRRLAESGRVSTSIKPKMKIIFMAFRPESKIGAG